MSVKFPFFGGGVFWGGGGSADFIFMGARIFQTKRGSVREPRNDLRESSDSSESANRFARIGPSKDVN